MHHICVNRWPEKTKCESTDPAPGRTVMGRRESAELLFGQSLTDEGYRAVVPGKPASGELGEARVGDGKSIPKP
jgi:hypothetical protein